MDYATLKSLHVTCVIVSAAGFVIRAVLNLRDPQTLQGVRAARILPHLIDTLLLASALGMVWQIGFGALGLAWLQTKLLLLPVYIALGAIALSPRRSRHVRGIAFASACLAFLGMLASALGKRPLGLDL